LDSNTKCPKVLLYYVFVNGIIDEEEDVMLATKLDLFVIGTITSLELKILVTMVDDAKISINVKIDTNAKLDINGKIGINAKNNTYAKIGIDVEISMDPKIGTNIKIDINIKMVPTNRFFNFHTHQEKFWSILH
jgi:hypothetical protein